MNLAIIEREITLNDPTIRQISIRAFTYNGDQTLIAFICFKNCTSDMDLSENIKPHIYSEYRLNLEDLKSKLHRSLEKHMIPAFYIPVSHIPLTLSGRVNQNKLRTFLISLPSKDLESYMIL